MNRNEPQGQMSSEGGEPGGQESEQALPGGVANRGKIVRIGLTVHRPQGPTSAATGSVALTDGEAQAGWTDVAPSRCLSASVQPRNTGLALVGLLRNDRPDVASPEVMARFEYAFVGQH